VADLVKEVLEMYAAFGRGDVQTILSMLAADVVWETEAPAALSFGGIRHGVAQTEGFFAGLAKEHADPKLEMKEFFTAGDAVAVFGRYEATVRTTGKRVSTPVAHYFNFRDGKVVRYIGLLNTGAFVEAMKASSAAA